MQIEYVYNEDGTINIRKTVKTPSNALKHMVEGLKKEWVAIDFDTFGSESYGVCYGCAATNAICNIANKRLFADSIYGLWRRSAALNFRRDELGIFESALDDIRKGPSWDLFIFFRIERELYIKIEMPNFYMDNGGYKDQLPKVEKYIKYLESKGL